MSSSSGLPTSVKPERAILHTLHATGKWTKASTQVAIETKSFAEGAFRRAHVAHLLWEQRWKKIVCKFAKDKTTPRSLYFKDIEAQVFATVWANKYNKYDPPKPVEFAACFVLELVDRPGRPVCGSESFIAGQFMKYNNNVGAVCTGGPNDPKVVMDRKTGQAFSHFTFDASQGQILICDIQGVDGTYTDPQIHTLNGKGFGSGNLGHTGIRAFLLRHKCNEVCKAVGLETIHAKELGSGKVDRSRATFKFTTLSDMQPGATGLKRSKSQGGSRSPASPSSPSAPSPSKAPEKPALSPGQKESKTVNPLHTSNKKSNASAGNEVPIQANLKIEIPQKEQNLKKTKTPKSIMDEADEKLMASILNGLSMSP
eukprot:CAMPEP_0184490202 /NCGR_PEP_ID=MMETSP0113_2-20130426/17293_1 /TAXON_ID=91329 /ORGANISM="Norrisiella sphaerica, Strain BC52" /LENGTH=369 /DNA_ID=CAMNT_0026873981 /DNA_START=143 /DNA_END=1252 /DNA_ORIENTATION=+